MADLAIVEADLIARMGTKTLVELTTDSGSSIDSTKTASIVAAAMGKVHAYLAKRYDTPLTAGGAADEFVKALMLDLAVHESYALRPPVPEHAEKMYERTMEVLNQIAKGEVLLPAADLVSTTADEPPAEIGYNERVASRTTFAEL